MITAPLRVLELLAARLCHDLISPVTAIANGAELLGEDDPEFVPDAVALIGTSARNANARLQFFRFAYGFAGSALAGPKPHQLVAEYFADTPVSCHYGNAARALPIDKQKLACMMLLGASGALLRGGQLVVEAASGAPGIDATGEAVLLSPEMDGALTLATNPAELTTRTVAAYFAGLLAAAQGRRLVLSERRGGFRLEAPPA